MESRGAAGDLVAGAWKWDPINELCKYLTIPYLSR
jgi:hypothetical protein